MSYRVSASSGGLSKLRFNEQDTVASVLQNIAMILSTPKGSVPMHRDFGLEMEFLDMPTSQAEVLMVAPVREAIQRWEPRAAVLDVSFSEDPARPGVLIPIVEVEISLEQEQ